MRTIYTQIRSLKKNGGGGGGCILSASDIQWSDILLSNINTASYTRDLTVLSNQQSGNSPF